jgi:hypothetical protein
VGRGEAGGWGIGSRWLASYKRSREDILQPGCVVASGDSFFPVSVDPGGDGWQAQADPALQLTPLKEVSDRAL